MARRIVAGSGWNTVRVGSTVVVVVVMSSSIDDPDPAFPWLSVRDRVPIVHDGGGCGRGAGTMVLVVPDARHRAAPSPMRCATSRSPVSSTARRTSANRGVERCRRCRVACGSTPSPRAAASWSSATTAVELQSGDLALVPHGAGHRIEAGGPTEYPLIPDLPHEEQSDNYAVLRYGDDGPLTRVGLRRTASGAPQRPPPAGRPPARGPRPHRSPHGARRDARPARRGGARPRGGKRGGDQPIVRHPRHPGHPPLDDERRGDRLAVAASDGRPTGRPGARRAARRAGRAVDRRVAGLTGGDVPLGVRCSLPRAPRPARHGLPDRASHAARRRPAPPQRPNRRRGRHRRRLRVRRVLQPGVQAPPRHLAPRMRHAS